MAAPKPTCPICGCIPLLTTPSKSNSPRGEPISAASLSFRSARLSRMPKPYLSRRKPQRRRGRLPKPSASTAS